MMTVGATMKALEFQSELAEHDQISVPADIARQIPAGSDVRVILLVADEDESWRNAAAEAFAAAYSDEDSVYEELIAEPPVR